MAHVADHLSIEVLKQRYRACAARHYQTIWLLAQGHTITDVGALTSFVPRWIKELLANRNWMKVQGQISIYVPAQLLGTASPDDLRSIRLM